MFYFFGKSNKKDFHFFAYLIIFVIVLLTITSCVTNRRTVYTQRRDPKSDDPSYFSTTLRENKLIKPGDELYLRVSSFDEETNFFSQTRDDIIGRTEVTLISYTVNENGDLRLPYIGTIKVANLTLDEASERIKDALDGYLNRPSVILKFVNKHITVLGEVTRPGRYPFADVSLSIFQALGLAGDINYYGNRNNVMLIREENKVITRNYLDLTNESLFGSYYYYIRPNDVIYVEPLKRRRWGFRDFPFELILSSVTTFLLILNYTYVTTTGR